MGILRIDRCATELSALPCVKHDLGMCSVCVQALQRQMNRGDLECWSAHLRSTRDGAEWPRWQVTCHATGDISDRAMRGHDLATGGLRTSQPLIPTEKPMNRLLLATAIASALIALPMNATASSHREAPAIGGSPRLDNTDVYAFNSYESGRTGFVTLIANFNPFQDPGGGPNFYPLDTNAQYTINIDNNGDAQPDIAFVFAFTNTYKDISLPVGGESVAIPILNPAMIGPGALDTTSLDRVETYSVDVVRNGQRRGDNMRHSDNRADSEVFIKPVDNIGNKSIPNYSAYAQQHIYSVNVPGCSNGGSRLFVGQRKEGFVVNVGEIFDLVNLNPLGAVDEEKNSLRGKNITTLALELPANCLTSGNDPVIGVWSTVGKSNVVSRGRGNERVIGRIDQVSRLGMPLVNEVVIGNPDKDAFNASSPADDGQFLTYVTNPVLPELLEVLFPVTAPDVFPRTDLVSVFLTGVDGLNKPINGVPSEMLRLNTTTPTRAAAAQNPMGVIGGDTAGYPNGRRPGDDVVDISLRVVMGVLLTPAQAPSGQLPFTDQAFVDASMFDSTFPYLLTPIPGSPNEATADGSVE